MTIQTYLDALNLQTTTQGLEQLQEFVTNHLALFSFSSVNAMQGKYLSLELNDVIERLVIQRQGGYCFEHNKLAFYGLQALGYEVEPLLARVKLNGRQDNPRTHRTTLVRCPDKTFLIDVGFGAKCPQAPIDVTHSHQRTIGQNKYQLIRQADDITLALTAPESITLYSADFSFVTEQDFEVGHFYSHQHPRASFVNNLVLSRHVGSLTHTLLNGMYSQTDNLTDESIQFAIVSHDQLIEVLQTHFLVQYRHETTQRVFDHILSYRVTQEAQSSNKKDVEDC